MLKIQVDNEDGTIDWEQRARVAILIERMVGGTKKTLMAKLNDPPLGDPGFPAIVERIWDETSKRGKKNENKKRIRKQ